MKKPPLVVGCSITPMRIREASADEMFLGLRFTTVSHIGGPETQTPEIALSIANTGELVQELQRRLIQAQRILEAEQAQRPLGKRDD